MSHVSTQEAAGKPKIGGGEALNQVIKIDEAQIKDHLGQMVRRSVEETLNGMLATVASKSLCAGALHSRRREAFCSVVQ